MFHRVIAGARVAGGGVAAAVQVARMGHEVLLVSPAVQLGGLNTAGLGFTGVGRREAVGGLAREFCRRLDANYRQPAAWRWQEREAFNVPRAACRRCSRPGRRRGVDPTRLVECMQ